MAHKKQHECAKQKWATNIDSSHGYAPDFTVILCVDCHSGYLVAVPAKDKGLTAEAVTSQMIRYWLTVFSTPKAIYSDNGSHSTGACFRTMCRLMGVRHARTMASHSRSNGRAEVAGRQLLDELKKLHLERPGRFWLTSMLHAIGAYHDLPTHSGYSPHQILFGMDRIEQGLPWATLGKALDCEELVANAEEMAATVTGALTKEHEKRRHYQERAPVTKYKVGNPMWLERPSKLSKHGQATYYVPAEVQKQLGEYTYTLKVGERLY